MYAHTLYYRTCRTRGNRPAQRTTSSSACCSRLASRSSAVRACAGEGEDDDECDDEDEAEAEAEAEEEDDDISTDWIKCEKVRSNRAPAIWRGVSPPKVSALSAEYISCKYTKTQKPTPNKNPTIHPTVQGKRNVSGRARIDQSSVNIKCGGTGQEKVGYEPHCSTKFRRFSRSTHPIPSPHSTFPPRSHPHHKLPPIPPIPPIPPTRAPTTYQRGQIRDHRRRTPGQRAHAADGMHRQQKGQQSER